MTMEEHQKRQRIFEGVNILAQKSENLDDLKECLTILIAISDISLMNIKNENEERYKFEDIAFLPNIYVQKLLRELDLSTLAIALFGASEEVTRVIFNNVSPIFWNVLNMDMEISSHAHVDKVRDAQKHIIDVFYKLESDEFPLWISEYQGNKLVKRKINTADMMSYEQSVAYKGDF